MRQGRTSHTHSIQTFYVYLVWNQAFLWTHLTDKYLQFIDSDLTHNPQSSSSQWHQGKLCIQFNPSLNHWGSLYHWDYFLKQIKPNQTKNQNQNKQTNNTSYTSHYPYSQNTIPKNLAWTVCTEHASFKDPAHNIYTQTHKDTVKRRGDKGSSVTGLNYLGV